VDDADVDVILTQLDTVRGDTDLDRDVDLTDWNHLSTNFGRAGIWEAGDFDHNGIVNLQDYNVLQANFGYDHNGFALLPEPMAAIAVLAAPMLLRRRLPRQARQPVGPIRMPKRVIF
jgi:hypothetical protein